MLRDKGHEICFMKSVMGDKGEHYKPEKREVVHGQKGLSHENIHTAARWERFAGFGKVPLTGFH